MTPASSPVRRRVQVRGLPAGPGRSRTLGRGRGEPQHGLGVTGHLGVMRQPRQIRRRLAGQRGHRHAVQTFFLRTPSAGSVLRMGFRKAESVLQGSPFSVPDGSREWLPVL